MSFNSFFQRRLLRLSSGLEKSPAIPNFATADSACGIFDLTLIFENVSEETLEFWSERSRRGILRIRYGASADILNLVSSASPTDIYLEQIFKKEAGLHSQILRRGHLKVYPHSAAQTIDGVLNAISAWWSNIEVSIPGEANTSQMDEAASPLAPPFSLPEKSTRWFRLWAQELFAASQFIFSRLRRLFFYQKWNVAVVHRSLKSLMGEGVSLDRQWIPQADGTQFIADPFPVFHEGKIKLFVEKYDFHQGKGVVIEMDPYEGWQKSQQSEAIALPTHISYPSMIADGVDLYCVPETLGENEVSLYHCAEYPHRWVKISTLLKDGLWSDPTLFFHQDRWWLFATKYDQISGGNDQLYAFFADDLRSDWTAHKQNPIKVDVRSARSAGSPFSVDGVLYRPSQDCSQVYGGAVILQKVTELSPTSFSETEVKRFHPDEHYPDGCHHLSGHGEMTLIDGRREEFSLTAPFVKLRQRLAPKAVIPKSFAEPNEVSSVSSRKKEFKVQTSW